MEFLFYLFLAYCWGSLCEWVAHKYLMHSPNSLMRGVLRNHLLHHKGYYNEFLCVKKVNDGEMSAEFYVGVVLCFEHVLFFMSAPIVYGIIFNASLAWAFALFGLVYWRLYNEIHTALHFGKTIPYLPKAYLQGCLLRHRQHHKNPSYFYNVALPGADYVFGTWYSYVRSDDGFLLISSKNNSSVNQHILNLNRYNNCIKEIVLTWLGVKRRL